MAILNAPNTVTFFRLFLVVPFVFLLLNTQARFAAALFINAMEGGKSS